MNTLFMRTLISQAESQIKNVSPNLVRAANGFLPERSLELAIHDLRECQRILELAKTNIHNSVLSTHTCSHLNKTNAYQHLK